MENNAPLVNAEKDSLFSFEDLLSLFWSSRLLILKICAVVTAAAIVISLLMTPLYKSTAIILPEVSQSKLAALGGLSDLAALAGVNVGAEASPAKLYPVIVKSEAVLKNVIYRKYRTLSFPDSANLLEVWKIDEESPLLSYEKMLKILQDDLEVTLDTKTSVLTVSLSTKEPQLSADILNAIAHELDVFLRTKRTTNASEQRKWIEGRLREVKSDLENSENALKDFRETNRRVTDSPELLLEQERLLREVQINSSIFGELKKQYEIAKIEEIKNVSIVNVMDPGRPAGKKDKPERGIIVIISFFLSLLAGMSFVYVRSVYGGQFARVKAFLASKISRKT